MSVNPFSLEGKKILVTGASSGIGQAVAIECSRMGARLVITGRDPERLNRTFEALEGGGHTCFAADLSSVEDIRRLVEFCPVLDGVSNNAGITKVLLVKFIQEKYLHDVLGINVLGPILLTQSLVRKKKLNQEATIVFTSSLSGVYCVHYGESMYAASKGAINGFAKGAALDLAAARIRVNCVNPGIVKTPLFENASILTAEELQEKELFFPLKRFGRPQDIAFAIMFFLSDASSWITGDDLVIDGGYTLK